MAQLISLVKLLRYCADKYHFDLLCCPAEEISFCPCKEGDDDFKLLGIPFFSDVEDLYPSMLSPFQMDSHDDWNLSFHDCGMLIFLISPENLKKRLLNNTIYYLNSL